MKCPTCDNDIHGYRDNARPADPPTPKLPFVIKIEKDTVAMLLRTVGWIAVWVLSSLAIASCGRAIFVSHNDAVMHRKQWEEKMGYVVVEYSLTSVFDNRTVLKCWVMPPHYYVEGDYRAIEGPTLPGDDIHIAHPYNLGWIEVPDRNDIDGFARHMGVIDPSTCIR